MYCTQHVTQLPPFIHLHIYKKHIFTMTKLTTRVEPGAVTDRNDIRVRL
jgi:hypothetical protein